MKSQPVQLHTAMRLNTLKTVQMFQFFSEPWLVLSSAYAATWAAFVSRLEAQNGDGWGEEDDELDEPIRYTVGSDGVACLPVVGMMIRGSVPGWLAQWGYVGMDDIAKELDRFAGDASARALVLNIDSGGGHAMGCPELAAKVREIDAKKPIIGFTAGYMASAAYFLGSQGSAVIAQPSAQVGCIGTLMSWLDISGYYEQLGVKREVLVNDGATFKGMALPGTSLTDEQREFLQGQVTKMGDGFKDAVREKRKCDNDAMRGQCLFGSDAVAAKLVDDLGDLNAARLTAQTLAAIRAGRAS